MATTPADLEITVPPDQVVGSYANVCAVSTQTQHDFTLDFCQVVPGAEKPMAVVVARLKLAPTLLMPLMQALSAHLDTFESQMKRISEGDVESGEEDE